MLVLTRRQGKGLTKGKDVDRDRGTTMDVNNDLYGEDYDSEELLSLSGSSSDDEEGGHCKRKRVKYPQFNSKSDMVESKFKLGMLFKTAAKFRAAVRQHAIKWGKEIRFTKNEKCRVRAVCREGCDWLIYASSMAGEKTMQVKTLKGEHSCNRTFKVKHANEK